MGLRTSSRKPFSEDRIYGKSIGLFYGRCICHIYNDLRSILLLLRDLNFSAITLKTKKVEANFVVTEKGFTFAFVNDIQRGHEDVTRRQIIAVI